MITGIFTETCNTSKDNITAVKMACSEKKTALIF